MSGAVFDASVTTRWFIEDDPLFHDCLNAREAHNGVAPMLVIAETANALWRYVRAGRLNVDAACDAVAIVRDEIALIDDADLVRAAQVLSQGLDHPVYDCLYAALAMRSGLPLVSADLKFVRKFQAVTGLTLKPIPAVGPSS